MKQNKYIYAIIEVVVLAVVILLAFTVLNSKYLFGWIANNWTCYLIISLISLILIIFNKRIILMFMTVGKVIGGEFRWQKQKQ